MARIGYARVSTTDQNESRQLEALTKAECTKIFTDSLSGKDTNRPGLKKMLDYIREEDTVVITELDRLGRNMNDLTDLMAQIHQKGAVLEILSLPMVRSRDNLAEQKLLNTIMLEICKYMAETERKKILERQRQGIAIAKQQGKYKGRQYKYKKDDPRLLHAFELYRQGSTIKDAARKTGIALRTMYRYLSIYNIRRT